MIARIHRTRNTRPTGTIRSQPIIGMTVRIRWIANAAIPRKIDCHAWKRIKELRLYGSIAKKMIAVFEAAKVDTIVINSAGCGSTMKEYSHLLRDDEMFLANYGDTVTDVDLHTMVDSVRTSGAMGSFVAVKPNYSFHVVSVNDDGRVREMSDVTTSDMWVNGGYFVLRSEVLDDLRPGEELVEEPFQRLIAADRLLAHRHEGFWAPMDTLKDKQSLESLHESGRAPWQRWASGVPASSDLATAVG